MRIIFVALYGMISISFVQAQEIEIIRQQRNNLSNVALNCEAGLYAKDKEIADLKAKLATLEKPAEQQSKKE